MRSCPRCFLSYQAGLICALDGATLIETDDDPLLGHVLGRYRITELLGAGGSARVYGGEQIDLGRRVAVKVLSGEMSCHRRVSMRFEREAQAAGRIHHPNVVAVTDAGTTPEGVTYMIMERVDGWTLSRLLTREGA